MLITYNNCESSAPGADSSLWVSWADFIWGIMTLVLVAVDAVFLPLSLSWPSLIQSGTTLDLYYQACLWLVSEHCNEPSSRTCEVTPGLWISDIVVAFLIALHPAAQTVRWQGLRSYLCSVPRELSLALQRPVMPSPNGQGRRFPFDVTLARA